MNRQQKKRYRQIIMLTVALDLGIMGWLFYREMNHKIPDEIRISKENSIEMSSVFRNAWISCSDAITVSETGSYQITCYLLGVLPLKNIKVTPVEDAEVYISGDTVGVYMETDGVLVVDTGEIVSENGRTQDPARDIVRAGDYIVAVNHQPVSCKKDLLRDIQDLDGSLVTLKVRREEEIVPVALKPVKDAKGDFKLGIWVRDDTQGIGTLTFVDEEGRFGALGHGISDVDTGEILNIYKGALYDAEVLGIKKGMRGNPGELSGLIRYDGMHRLGNIVRNTTIGIFGTIGKEKWDSVSLKKAPVGHKQDLELGKAEILACIDGKVDTYSAEITKIDYNHEDTNKSFVIRVTDERLLETTGGIVQGMSGSPVLQNGKFVGAVTHVFVQDAASGYGIFAETMLQAAGSLD